jgi:hypothetical protein
VSLVVNRSRVLIGAAILVLVAGCASATHPALRSGTAELSRAELRDGVEELGVEIGPVVIHTFSDEDHPSFDLAASLLTIDLQVDDRLAAAGVELTAADYEAFNASNGLPSDLDLLTLPPIGRLEYDLRVKVTALSAATGIEFVGLVTEMYANAEIDPRYGTMTSRGLVPPGSPVDP